MTQYDLDTRGSGGIIMGSYDTAICREIDNRINYTRSHFGNRVVADRQPPKWEFCVEMGES